MHDPRIGAFFGGRYTLIEVLGRGGMGTVYRARASIGERTVAIKVLHDRFADDTDLRERLEREARSTQQLAHPNIIEILDFGLTAELIPYMVMEELHGESLDQPLKRNGAMSVDTAVPLALHMARGLGRAHDFGVVHRDIKPQNIFICRTDDGEPVAKLVDFGIALAPGDRRLTGYGEVLGSPRYMAPERFQARHDVTPASDLYGLGVVLFEMIAGTLPFHSESMAGWVLHHLETLPPDVRTLAPECPALLAELIAELLAKAPGERPVDAHAVVAALSRLATADALRVRRASVHSRELRSAGEEARLGAWRERARLYQQMLERIWPRGDGPPEAQQPLAELHGALGRLEALRAEARRLDQEVGAQDERLRSDRERIGHAIDTLAKDLSRARAQARERGEPADSGAAEPMQRYRAALAEVIDHDARRGDVPAPGARRALAEALDAYDAWLASLAPSAERDLEFQLQALRDRATGLDNEARAGRERRLRQLSVNAEEREHLEQRVLQVSRSLGETLRPFPQVRDLFRRMRRGTLRAIV